LEFKNKISRKKFFASIGITAALAYMASALPMKFVKSVSQNANRKHVKISIHPSAIKRTKKV
jgi:hypothetical protein